LVGRDKHRHQTSLSQTESHRELQRVRSAKRLGPSMSHEKLPGTTEVFVADVATRSLRFPRSASNRRRAVSRECSSISPHRNLSARTDSISRRVNREIKACEPVSAAIRSMRSLPSSFRYTFARALVSRKYLGTIDLVVHQ